MSLWRESIDWTMPLVTIWNYSAMRLGIWHGLREGWNGWNMDWSLVWKCGGDFGFMVDGTWWFLCAKVSQSPRPTRVSGTVSFGWFASICTGSVTNWDFRKPWFAGTTRILMEWKITWTRACPCWHMWCHLVPSLGLTFSLFLVDLTISTNAHPPRPWTFHL
jgi:hypothetical protein